MPQPERPAGPDTLRDQHHVGRWPGQRPLPLVPSPRMPFEPVSYHPGIVDLGRVDDPRAGGFDDRSEPAQWPERVLLAQLRLPVVAVVLAEQEFGRPVPMQPEAAPARRGLAQLLQREAAAQWVERAGAHSEVTQEVGVRAPVRRPVRPWPVRQVEQACLIRRTVRAEIAHHQQPVRGGGGDVGAQRRLRRVLVVGPGRVGVDVVQQGAGNHGVGRLPRRGGVADGEAEVGQPVGGLGLRDRAGVDVDPGHGGVGRQPGEPGR